MPTYSYECTECGDRFDAVQSFTEDSLTSCKQCSGRLRKLFNAVGVVFKGSGFYRTDSRESGKKSNDSSSGSSSTSDSTTSSGSTESKTSGSAEKSTSSTTSTATTSS
ncbi:FmdB family zinc ribbon protein [Mycobacterium sp.]|uniref:FmdB family zinc ribbon protein n=1 Tax=Mycobacterium sp. TaxID=1785 RepID=UPI003BA85077